MTQFRNLRLQKGLNQEEFRKLYNEKYNRNYTSAAISMIEHGKRMPELGALIDFADFYDVSLDYLLGRDSGDSASQQISRQIKTIADRIIALRAEENGRANELPEVRENMDMLRCLLQQSAVLAKRMEQDNSWYKF